MQREWEQTQAKMHDQRQAALSSNINGNFHSLEAHPGQACLSFAAGLEACLILAKSLLCCNFYSILWPISIASRPVSRPASRLASSQSVCFAAISIALQAIYFHSPKAWFEACLGTDCLRVSMSVRMYVCNHVGLSVCMTVCVDVCMSVCNLDAIPSRQLRPKILGCHPKATH